MNIEGLKNYVERLRGHHKLLQDEDDHEKSQNVDNIQSYIKDFENIFEFKNRPIILEKLSSLSLLALNDALKIQPNYPVGDDNEATCTAPANTPDIECFYESFNAIGEVTMLKNRDQWFNEGQPVMRHLRDFEDQHPEKPAYCLFIAPALHRDTINTFWISVKHGYEGRRQRIIPLSIQDFVLILKILLRLRSESKFLNHAQILNLYEQIGISSNDYTDSQEWISNIRNIILSWQESIAPEAP